MLKGDQMITSIKEPALKSEATASIKLRVKNPEDLRRLQMLFRRPITVPASVQQRASVDKNYEIDLETALMRYEAQRTLRSGSWKTAKQ